MWASGITISLIRGRKGTSGPYFSRVSHHTFQGVGTDIYLGILRKRCHVPQYIGITLTYFTKRIIYNFTSLLKNSAEFNIELNAKDHVGRTAFHLKLKSY